jgi:cytochrome b subunit of formate dehydrogenase
MKLGFLRTTLLALATTLSLAGAPTANPDAACLACHGVKPGAHAKGSQAPYVDKAEFAGSIHGANGCTSCHTDVDPSAHPGGAKPGPVVCASCHDKASKSYDASAHGKLRKAGNTSAAGCAECHGTHGILRSSDPASPVSRAHLYATCGQCHPDVAADVQASVHGQAVAKGIVEAPVCTDCHFDHAIQDLRGASTLTVARDVCSRCHGSTRMNAKFDLPNDRVSTFFDSYHGMAARLGSPRAANCASCHGYHLVLPASDERSSVNKANLVKTCQKCHPNANEKFSLGTIHVDKKDVGGLGSKVDHFVRQTYLSLILITIGAMALHNILVFRRKALAALRDPNRTVVRMDLAARIQHVMLAASFIFLVISGFALKYPTSWLGWCMGSSETVRHIGHRIAACVMITGAVVHLCYVIFTRDGHRFVLDMLPEVKDLTDLATHIKYLIVPGAQRPRFKRFGYAEKAEYWAVVWGTLLMGTTGALIWFKIWFTQWLPRWVIDVCITVHYYEAILATLAILVWHFYFVIFDPDVYPVNFAFLDGKVTPHHHHEEHPLDHGPEPTPSDSGEEDA